MMTDLYELTMAQVYFNSNERDKIAVFDAFFRKEPLGAGYGIMAGLDNIIKYVNELHFSSEDIDYLRSLNQFSDDFLNYLSEFKFHGDIYAVPDGTPIFRNEPIVTVVAPIIEAQIIETAILSYLNASICYATATKRITEVTKSIGVMEFGARRAFGPDAAVEASKCSIIGGAVGTSNVLAGKIYGMPVLGTMAHSLVTEADSEYEAFLNYAKTYPNNCVLLVDTYDTLRSGIPNAIRIAKEYLIPNGYELKGVRIDSGDLAYLSIEAKKMFEEAGLPNVKICLSNGLKAETLASLIGQGAVIDSIGLGDNIVAPDNARVGCVYKNVAVYKDGEIIPKIKVSSDAIKTTNPGFKHLYRFFDNKTGYAIGDLITLHDEVIPNDGYTLVDPENDTNFLRVKNYTVKNLREKIFENGELIYKDPTVFEKRDYCTEQMTKLYPEIKRIAKPHKYYVDLSEKLLSLKKQLIKDAKTNS
jgi:nicotinate phosphoribosyltransferase